MCSSHEGELTDAPAPACLSLSRGDIKAASFRTQASLKISWFFHLMKCCHEETFCYRFMYWTDWGENPKIESAWMDGERRKVLVQEDLGWPTGLCIDYMNDDRIYWSDLKDNIVETIKYDGTDRRIVVTSG